MILQGLPRWHSDKECACQCRRCGFDRVRKIPWRRKWQPTAIFLPAEAHGLRNLEGYSLWGCKRVGKQLSMHAWYLNQGLLISDSMFLKHCIRQFKRQLFHVHYCIQTPLPRLCSLLSLIENTEPKIESLQEIQSTYKAFWYMGAYTQVHILIFLHETWNIDFF